MAGKDTISVIVPVRNGAAWIHDCLGSIAALHPGPDEVIVVDGGSDDGTAAIARQALRGFALPGRVLENPAGGIASNLNAGLAAASGAYTVRVDVRSRPPADYLARVVAGLQLPGVVLVGGVQVPTVPRRGLPAAALTRAHQNPVLAGMAAYRRAGRSGPAETVYLGGGCTDRLRGLGGWDERLEVNEDYDLAQRASRRGTVWLDGDLLIGWYAPDSTAAAMARLHRYGRAKARYWQITGQRPVPRQWAAVLTPVAITVAAGAAARHRVRLGALGTATVAACLATDLSVRRRAPVSVRVTSVVIGVAGAGAWWSGVVRGLGAWVAGRYRADSDRGADHDHAVWHGHRNRPTSDPSRAAEVDQSDTTG